MNNNIFNRLDNIERKIDEQSILDKEKKIITEDDITEEMKQDLIINGERIYTYNGDKSKFDRTKKKK